MRHYIEIEDIQGPHNHQPVLAAGVPLDQARAAALFVHGRGASAASILGLASEFDAPGVAFLAPQAASSAWYPYSFLAPMKDNQPKLDSALAMIGAVIGRAGEAGIPPERMLLLGFSQGACLLTEYAARYPQRYGGIAGLSGGLIGPDDTPRDYQGALAGTPVLLGCSDVDPYIPEKRVRETANVLLRLGATVDLRFYPGMGHTINTDELDSVQLMFNALVGD